MRLVGHGARRRACVAVAGCLAVVVTAGCSTSDGSLTGSKGYITGKGVVTTVDPDDRREVPTLEGEKLGGGSSTTSSGDIELGVGDADVGGDKGDADCEFGVCSAKLSLNGDRLDF